MARTRTKGDAGLIDLVSSGLAFADLDSLTGFKAVDATPDLPDHQIVHPGDLWLLGDHRLICGDSTDAKTVSTLLGSDRPHLMVTDPPYGVEYDPDWRNQAFRAVGMATNDRAVGTVVNDGTVDWSSAWRLFPGDVAYVWSASISVVQSSLAHSSFITRSLIIWNKSRFVIGRGDYHWKHEPCWYAVKKGKTSHYQGARDQTTVWDIAHTSSDSGHGTQKPVECMRRPIVNNSAKGEFVYEPFSGSGTTIIAAEDTGRRCLAIELNPLYVYVAIVRWQNYTGRHATLNGEPFAEIVRRRRDDPMPLPAPIIAPQARVKLAPTASKVTFAAPAPRILLQPAAPVSTWTAPTEMPSLRGVKRLTLDVETHDPNLDTLGPGVARGDAYIIGLGIGTDDGRRWYFPTRHEGGGNMDEKLVHEWARSELNAYTGEILGAHLLYDLEHLSAWGIDTSNASDYHDVLLAEPLIDEWRRDGYSLDAVCRYHLGEGKRHATLFEAAALYGWKTPKQVKQNLWRLPAGAVGAYAEGDVELPERVLAKQLEIIKREGLEKVYDVERGLTPLLLAMRLRGVRFDQAAAERARANFVVRRDEHLAQARRLAGTDSLELMAPESFASSLSDRGLHYPTTAKTGKPSITKAWLKANAGDALVDEINAGRRLDKIISTFCDGNLKYVVRGRIYPEFPQLKRGASDDDDDDTSGTIARFAGRHPNLTFQVKRDKEMAPIIRGFFLPEEGEIWESQDESQIEFRLLTHYAVGTGADEARRAYSEDPTTDFHDMAGEMAGIDVNDEYERGRIKSTNFCKVYMGGDRQLAFTLGCSLEEAQAFSSKYDQRLPFVRDTGKAAMSVAAERGYVVSILGRRQRFSLWETRERRTYANKRERMAAMLPHAEAVSRYGSNIRRAFTHAGLNRVLQSSAADIFKKAMVDTWRAGVCRTLGALLIPVHDENNWSVPRTKEGDEAAAEARWHMENAIKLRVPLRVDWKRGPNWGECK